MVLAGVGDAMGYKNGTWIEGSSADERSLKFGNSSAQVAGNSVSQVVSPLTKRSPSRPGVRSIIIPALGEDIHNDMIKSYGGVGGIDIDGWRVSDDQVGRILWPRHLELVLLLDRSCTLLQPKH
jgi:hypothetical protein